MSWELLRSKLLRSEALTDKELSVARDAIKEGRPTVAQVTGLEALLRFGSERDQAEFAYPTLRRLCRELIDRRIDNADLCLTLIWVPTDVLAENTFKSFLMQAVTSGSRGCRMNGILSLKRLAKHGDSEALDAIRCCSKDQDQSIRKNAVSALKEITLTP
jgi:hypothetical protein